MPETQPDFFSHNIPLWNGIFADLKGKPNLLFVEVGSLHGRSAEWLLQNVLTHPSSRLTSVDVFAETPESLAYCALLKYAPESPLSEREFDDRIAGTGSADRVTKLVGESERMLRTIPLHSVDCVYIDGSHTSRNVLTDLVLSWGVLKLGGILIADDYDLAMFADNPLKNPKIGIDAFLAVFRDEYEHLHGGRQVVLRKARHKDEIWHAPTA